MPRDAAAKQVCMCWQKRLLGNQTLCAVCSDDSWQPERHVLADDAQMAVAALHTAVQSVCAAAQHESCSTRFSALHVHHPACNIEWQPNTAAVVQQGNRQSNTKVTNACWTIAVTEQPSRSNSLLLLWPYGICGW